MTDVTSLTIKVSAKGAAQAQADLKKLGYEASTADKATAKLTKTSKLSAKATLALGIAVAGATALVGKAVKQWIAYDKKMKEVRSISGLTAKEFKSVRGELLGVAADIGVATDDIAAAAYQAVSAGVAAKDVGGFMRDAGKLAIAGVASTEASVDLLTTAINAYSLDASKATELSDKFFTTVKLGKTTIDELSSSFGTAAPLAATMGVSIDELLASVVVMTKQGINTSEAFTKLTSTMTALIKPSSEMADAIHGLGYSSGQAMIESLGLQGSLEALQKSVNGDSGAMAKLFPRVEALTGVLAVLKNEGGDTAEALDEIKTATGATAKAAKINSESLDVFFNKLKAMGVQALETGRAISGLNALLTDLSSGTFLQVMLNGEEYAKSVAKTEELRLQGVRARMAAEKENLALAKKVAEEVGVSVEHVKEMTDFHQASSRSLEGQSEKAKILLTYYGSISESVKYYSFAMKNLESTSQSLAAKEKTRKILNEQLANSKKEALAAAKQALGVAKELTAAELERSKHATALEKLQAVMAEYEDEELATLKSQLVTLTSRLLREEDITDKVRNRIHVIREEINAMEIAAQKRDGLAGEVDFGFMEDKDNKEKKAMRATSSGGGSSSVATDPLEQQKSDLETLQDGFLTELQLVQKQQDEKMKILNAARDANLVSIQEYADLEKSIVAESEASKLEIQEHSIQQKLDAATNFLSDIQTASALFGKKGAKVAKAAAIGMATIKTYESATSAYASLAGIPVIGPALGTAAAAAAIAAGMANIAAIKAQPESYATGGIVGGVSTKGDAMTANVNSGEMILNKTQQANLFDQANGKGKDKKGLTVNVTNNAPVEVETREDSNGNLELIIQQAVRQTKTELTQEAQLGGGTFVPALGQSFNLARS